MRWTVEADTTRDVVDWPEEVGDFESALSADLRARDAAVFADARVGSLSARFQVSADHREVAQDVAREIMVDALRRAHLRVPDDPIARVGVTPSR